jgi:glycosyltransferase involved in cell wall biosynthesis
VIPLARGVEAATAPTRLLVAIPCLNEAATVGEVIRQIPATMPGFDEVVVLVVDDGSTDDTRDVAEAAGAVVISHGHNRGVGAGFQTALTYAVDGRFDAMVNIDADGQFDPADIPLLLAPLLAGEADFVSASRFKDAAFIPDMPPVKHWGNLRMSSLISRLAGRRFFDVSCGFRAYGREAMVNLNLHGRFTYTQETFLDLADKGLRIVEVPVHVRYFPERRSRVANNLFKYATRTSSIVARFYRDYHPLRFFWALAALCAVVGLGFLSILAAHYLRTGLFTGQIWSGFVGSAFAFTGLVFFVTGIFADMLARLRQNQERILTMLKKHGPAPEVRLPPPPRR